MSVALPFPAYHSWMSFPLSLPLQWETGCPHSVLSFPSPCRWSDVRRSRWPRITNQMSTFSVSNTFGFTHYWRGYRVWIIPGEPFRTLHRGSAWLPLVQPHIVVVDVCCSLDQGSFKNLEWNYLALSACLPLSQFPFTVVLLTPLKRPVCVLIS